MSRSAVGRLGLSGNLKVIPDPDPMRVCTIGEECGGEPQHFTEFPFQRTGTKARRTQCKRCLRGLRRQRDQREKERLAALIPAAVVPRDDIKLALLPSVTSQENDWRQKSLCRDTGLDWWTNLTGNGRTVEWAKAVCAECPVRLACRDLGDLLDAVGPQSTTAFACVYGGESPTERVNRRARSNLKDVRKAIEQFIEDRKLDKATLVGGYFTMQTQEGRRDYVEDLAIKVVAINELIDEHQRKLAEAAEPEAA